MRIIETKIYQFEELTARGKEIAIHAARDCMDFTCYGKFIIEYAKDTAKQVLGWNISDVHYSGFYDVNSGAWFVGTVQHKDGLIPVSDFAPNDELLGVIVKRWNKLQQSNDCALSADVWYSGGYSRGYGTFFDLFDERTQDGYTDSTDTEDEIKTIVNLFRYWIYQQLLGEYDYQTSDEAIARLLIANEYEFTEDGGIV